MSDILKHHFATETAYKAFRHYFGNDYGIHYADGQGTEERIAFFTAEPYTILKHTAQTIDAAVLLLSKRQSNYSDRRPYILQYDAKLAELTYMMQQDIDTGAALILTEALRNRIDELTVELKIHAVEQPTGKDIVANGIERYTFELAGSHLNLLPPASNGEVTVEYDKSFDAANMKAFKMMLNSRLPDDTDRPEYWAVYGCLLKLNRECPGCITVNKGGGLNVNEDMLGKGFESVAKVLFQSTDALRKAASS